MSRLRTPSRALDGRIASGRLSACERGGRPGGGRIGSLGRENFGAAALDLGWTNGPTEFDATVALGGRGFDGPLPAGNLLTQGVGAGPGPGRHALKGAAVVFGFATWEAGTG